MLPTPNAYDIHQETAQAISNLVTATASDRSTVTSLTATNSSLNDELLQSNAKLTAASNEITALKIELAILKAAKPSATPGNSHRPRIHTEHQLLLDARIQSKPQSHQQHVLPTTTRGPQINCNPRKQHGWLTTWERMTGLGYKSTQQ
jgi:hypothetical protein